MMPRYFFHIFKNGRRPQDDVGVELDADEQVQFEAMRVLPAIANEDVPRDGDLQAFTGLVTDEAGCPIYTATLNFSGLWLGLGD